MSAADALMSQLVEMGFDAAQASTYSSAHSSLEAALEAIFRDEAAAQQAQPQPTQPASDPAAPFAAPAAPAAPSAAAAPTRVPPPLVTQTEAGSSAADEHKVDSPLALQPSEWQALCLPSSPLEPGTPDELDRELRARGPAPPVPEDTDEAQLTAGQFEVLHSSLFTPSDATSSLRQWGSTKLRALFAKLEQGVCGGSTSPDAVFSPDVASPTETRLETPSETSSVASSSVGSSATPSVLLSACSTPRNNREADEEDEEEALCVVCFDQTRDTLLLPCRHFALCSSCALGMVSRVRGHNHEVYLVQLAAAEEARRSSSFLMPTVHKMVQRVCACPTCSTPVQHCVRRKSVTTNVQ